MIDVLYGFFNERFGFGDTPLRLLHYTTFRMVLAFLTAFAVTFVISPRTIAMLYRRGMRDQVRSYQGSFSSSKSGTPTMGGLIIIGALLFSVLLWCNPLPHAAAPEASPIPLLVMTLIFYGGIGAVDDLLKVRRGGSDHGLSRKVKLVFQAAFATLFAVLVLSDGTSPMPESLRTQLYFPGIPTNFVAPFDLGIFYFPFVILAFLCISNAINFADGLDGLAVVPASFCGLVMGIFAYVFSHQDFAKLVDFHHVAAMGEVSVFAAAFLGAGMGFLWFNSYPAQVFMGDTGSMALGGTLAALSVLTKTELLFLLLGGIFVYEFVSVVIQDYIGIKRLGRRLLFRAPAHHGFQHQGVAETKVVLRFWIVSFVLALLSLATLKMR